MNNKNYIIHYFYCSILLSLISRSSILKQWIKTSDGRFVLLLCFLFIFILPLLFIAIYDAIFVAVSGAIFVTSFATREHCSCWSEGIIAVSNFTILYFVPSSAPPPPPPPIPQLAVNDVSFCGVFRFAGARCS